MATTISDIERVHTLAATIEAGGVIDKQWGFATDTLQIIVRNGANYYRMAGIDAANTFTAANIFSSTVNVAGLLTTAAITASGLITANGGLTLGAGADIIFSATSDVASDIVIQGTNSLYLNSRSAGAGADIFHNATNIVINNKVVAGGFFVQTGGGTNALTINASQAATFTGTLAVTGLITANGGLTLGAGDDLIGSSTSDITMDTDKLKWDSANNRLGIGTATPLGKLHSMSGSAGGSGTVSANYDELVLESATNGGLTILNPVGNNGGISFSDEDGQNRGLILYRHLDDSLDLWTAGASRLIIASTGVATSKFGITLAAGADLIGSSTSDINMNSLFTVAGATGNATAGTLTLNSINNAINLLISDSSTDASTKDARVGSAHYTNAEEPMATYFATSTVTTSLLQIGGGTGLFNAATSIDFYAAANNTTLTGTKVASITTAGITLAAGADLIGSSTSDITMDTDKLKWDSATNRLGIGTASPSAALHVAGTGSTTIIQVVEGAGTQTDIAFVDPATTGVGHVRVGSKGDILQFRSGNVNNMDLDASGNLDIKWGTLAVTGMITAKGGITLAAGSDLLRGSEDGWTSDSETDLGAGASSGANADSARDSVADKSIIIVTPTSGGVDDFYGFTGLVNKREYTIINNGCLSANIVTDSTSTVQFSVPVYEARKFVYYGTDQYPMAVT